MQKAIMSSDKNRVTVFVESIKNAGVIISGEEIVLSALATADCPQKALIALAEQGRPLGVTFYQRGLGLDVDRAVDAFIELRDPSMKPQFLKFLASLKPNPAPEKPTPSFGS
jgi:hypothetical protein